TRLSRDWSSDVCSSDLKKQNILKALFAGKVSPEITGFFDIMVRKGRAELVYATALEFIREYNELRGIVNAQVISAAPMSAENLEIGRASCRGQVRSTAG